MRRSPLYRAPLVSLHQPLPALRFYDLAQEGCGEGAFGEKEGCCEAVFVGGEFELGYGDSHRAADALVFEADPHMEATGRQVCLS